MAADKLRAAEQTKGLHTFFKLQTTISCDNMVLFDQNGCMKKYNDAGEILKDFYDLRFAFYGKRKQYLEGKIWNLILLHKKLVKMQFFEIHR